MKINLGILIITSLIICGYILPNNKSKSENEFCGNKFFFEDTISLGRQLFLQNCASCHNLRKPTTGPALGNITRKRTKKYLYQFIKDWTKLIDEKNCFAVEASKYSFGQMSKFVAMNDDAIDSILQYIEKESIKQNIPFKEDGTKALMDSCEKYTESLLKFKKLEKRNYKEEDRLKAILKKWKPKSKQCLCEQEKIKNQEDEESYTLINDAGFLFTAKDLNNNWDLIATNDSLLIIKPNSKKVYYEVTIWKSNKRDAYLIMSENTKHPTNNITIEVSKDKSTKIKNDKKLYKVTFNPEHNEKSDVGEGYFKKEIYILERKE